MIGSQAEIPSSDVPEGVNLVIDYLFIDRLKIDGQRSTKFIHYTDYVRTKFREQSHLVRLSGFAYKLIVQVPE
jgi:hypothetical protein